MIDIVHNSQNVQVEEFVLYVTSCQIEREAEVPRWKVLHILDNYTAFGTFFFPVRATNSGIPLL